MFNVRPDNDVHGFRVRPLDSRSDADVPGFRVKATEGVPGFHVSGDGSPQPAFVTGRPPSHQYVNVNSPYPYPLGGSAYPDATLLGKIRDPDWVMPRLGATFDGAISVVPGLWNAGRAVWRAAGGLGKEEAQRFDQEMVTAGKVLGKAAEHPEQAARVAGEVWSELNKDPMFPYHLAGRAFAGSLVGVGPLRIGVLAAMGDTLRAVEKGYGSRDIVRQAIEGNPWLRFLGR
jgi:hypothetical protein